MKVVYILSNHGKNKNYVNRAFNNGVTFTRDKSKAYWFSRDDAENMRKYLMDTMGNAYVEDK